MARREEGEGGREAQRQTDRQTDTDRERGSIAGANPEDQECRQNNKNVQAVSASPLRSNYKCTTQLLSQLLCETESQNLGGQKTTHLIHTYSHIRRDYMNLKVGCKSLSPRAIRGWSKVSSPHDQELPTNHLIA